MYGGLYGGVYGGLYGGLYGGYGYGYWGKRESVPPAELLNRTECFYTRETKVLACHGSTGVEECTAELKCEKPVEFQLYGIGLPESTSDLKFRIFPRKLDNSGWEKDVIGDKHISLYHAGNFTDLGLLVKDKACFEKISQLLRASLRNEIVEIDDSKVTIVGDLMSNTKKQSMTVRDDGSSDFSYKYPYNGKRSHLITY